MADKQALKAKYEELQAQLHEKQGFIGQLNELIQEIESDCEYIRDQQAEMLRQIQNLS